MALVQSDYAKGIKPMPIPAGQEVVTVLIPLSITAPQTASGNIYEMGYLPENCALVDATFAATDIDTNGTPTHAMSFGVINSAGTDLNGPALQTNITVGRAGTVTDLTKTLATLTTNCDGKTRKKLGYRVTTASATGAAGTVYLELSYRRTSYGI